MKIWDLPTRLYHWLQAFLFVGLIATGYQGEGPHLVLGLSLFTILVWRVLWGFVGSQTSRFAHFIRSPGRVLRYFRGQYTAGAGHNPAGGWMVLAMLISLLLQCLSGLVLAGFADGLPLADVWLTDSVFDAIALMHGLLAYGLPFLIGLHLIAILLYKLGSKPLVWAMVTGYHQHLNGISLRFESNKRALLVLLAPVLVTIAIVALS